MFYNNKLYFHTYKNEKIKGHYDVMLELLSDNTYYFFCMKLRG